MELESVCTLHDAAEGKASDMLKRKAYRALEAWKRFKTKQALLVDGARQVGKTFLVREFGQANYDHVVELNLLENTGAREALASAGDTAELFLRLSAFADQPLVPGKTLVFLDEVQACPNVLTMIKFLCERQDYDYILSGSMLGVEMRNVRSVPVGYLMTETMHPLDFEEFTWAAGIGDDVWDEVRRAFEDGTPVDDYVHRRLLQLFHGYLVCGGMPDAVQTYFATDDIQRTRALQGGIVQMYRNDISQYAGDRARTVKRIFDLIPSELNNQNKRFVIKDIEGRSRIDRYDNDFLWLADANVALPVYNVDEPRYPLMLAMNSTKFKLFLADVGLLTYECGLDVVRSLLTDRTDINYGSIYENAVAQELTARGHRLFFFKNRSIGELDFLIEQQGRVIPLEVKSGKSYKRHSALNNVLHTPNYGIERAIVLGETNVETEGPVRYLPIYMTGLLESGRRSLGEER